MYRPEVGEECEYRLRNSTNWFKCVVRYYLDKQGAIIETDRAYNGEQYCSFNSEDKLEFRPLKSKRDEEIANMCSAAKFENLISLKETMSNLYDAGYRKQMPYAEFVQIITDYLYDNFTGYDNAMSHADELSAKINRTPDEG